MLESKQVSIRTYVLVSFLSMSIATVAISSEDSCEDIYGDDPIVTWKKPSRLVQLSGTSQEIIFNPQGCDEAQRGCSDTTSPDEGTYNHTAKFLLYIDPVTNQRYAIVFWRNHWLDENAPGERSLAKIGRITNDNADTIEWTNEVFELSPPPAQMCRRNEDYLDKWKNKIIDGYYVIGGLLVIDDSLYYEGRIMAAYGWTNNVKFRRSHEDGVIPEIHWQPNKPKPSESYKWDVFFHMGFRFIQKWKIQNGRLIQDSPMYQVETKPMPHLHQSGRYLLVQVTDESETCSISPSEELSAGCVLAQPFASAYRDLPPVSEAPDIEQDYKYGERVSFTRNPKYRPKEGPLACNDNNGLSHSTMFRRQDREWIAIRDNLQDRGHYFAAKRDSDGFFQKGRETNLDGYAEPAGGELPDGRPYIIGNNDEGRKKMYLTLSKEGRHFDQTWLIHSTARDYWTSQNRYCGGAFKGDKSGPQYFHSLTIGRNIWVVYSVGKQQIGVTKIPTLLFYDKYQSAAYDVVIDNILF